MIALWLVGLAALLSACGGSSTSQSVIAVSTPQLKTIAVDPPDPTLALGLTTQFTATGIYTDGSQQDLSRSVTWASSNSAVASVSNGANANGLTTAVSQGTATITATLGLVSGKAALTVTPAALEFIAVTPLQSSLAKGHTQQFAATGIYSDHSLRDLSTTVTWVSLVPGVATISNAPATYGLATGVALGTTTITAALANLSGSTTLTVTATTLMSITVTPANASIVKGATQQFTATGTYADGTTQVLTGVVTWSSGTPAVATVNAAGLATAVNIGSTLITATLGTVSGSSGLTVAGATLVSIAVTPASATLTYRANQPQPSTQAFTATGTYSDGSTQTLTTATWTSSVPGVATISNTGLATAVGVGTTLITATLGNISSPPPDATLTVNAATQFAYAVNYNNAGNGSVFQYSIAPATGSLTALLPPPEPVPAGDGSFSLAVDPKGEYLYVANYNPGVTPGSVSQYSIGADGVLTPIGTPVATGSEPNGITVDPSGRFVYVANANDGTVSQYSITTGLLTAIPVPVAVAGIQAASVVVDPTDTYAYVANYGDGTNPGSVSEYAIGDNGALTALVPATLAAGIGTNDVVIAPGGNFLYAVNELDNTVSSYAIGAGGVLGAAVVRANAASGLHAPRHIVFDTANHAYVTNRFGNGLVGNDVVEFTVSPTTGVLNLLGNGSVPAYGAEGIAIDATNTYVYVTDRYTNPNTAPPTPPGLSEFSINADGTLTLVGTIPLTGTVPTGIVTAY